MYDGTLGERVARLRTAKRVTQEDLAFRAEISVTGLKNIEADRADPKVTTAKRIAKALGCPVSLLVDDADNSDDPLVLAHRLTHALEAQRT